MDRDVGEGGAPPACVRLAENAAAAAKGVERGGYVVIEALGDHPALVLVAVVGGTLSGLFYSTFRTVPEAASPASSAFLVSASVREIWYCAVAWPTWKDIYSAAWICSSRKDTVRSVRA